MGRRVLALVLMAGAIVSLVAGGYAARTGNPLEVFGWVAGIVSALLAVWLMPRRSAVERVSTPAQLDHAEQALRSAIGAYVSDELARRGLDDLFIPLRGRRDDQTQFEIGGLVTPFPSDKRILLVGESGLGKSTACLMISRALVGDPREAVPVVLPATSWLATYESLERWAIEWITSTVRIMGNTTAYGDTAVSGLLGEGRIRCVVDGLDELPSTDQQELLKALADARTPFVLTSRPAPLRGLRSELTEIRGLRRVTLLPARPLESLDYLATVDPRWHDVDIAAIERLLVSPLNVYLMRHAYFELSGTGPVTERRLWRALVPAMFDGIARQASHRTSWHRAVLRRRSIRSWRKEKAQRWLSFLASDLAEPTGELRWWAFRKRVEWSEGALIVLLIVLAMVSEAVEVLVAGNSSNRAGTAVLTGIGLTVMVVFVQRRMKIEAPGIDISRGLSLTAGIGAGALAGVAYGPVAGLAALVVGFVGTTIAGVPLVARSLARQRTYTSPASALRTARRVALIGFVPAYVVIMTAMYLVGNNAPFSASTAACVFAGHVLLSSLWGGYLSARLTCAVNRQLPLRLNRFLDDMSRIGLLRRVGPHYAFRHRLLRNALAPRPVNDPRVT